MNRSGNRHPAFRGKPKLERRLGLIAFPKREVVPDHPDSVGYVDLVQVGFRVARDVEFAPLIVGIFFHGQFRQI